MDMISSSLIADAVPVIVASAPIIVSGLYIAIRNAINSTLNSEEKTKLLKKEEYERKKKQKVLVSSFFILIIIHISLSVYQTTCSGYAISLALPKLRILFCFLFNKQSLNNKNINN